MVRSGLGLVKTAGVDEENLTFSGPSHIFESQDDVAGEVVVIRCESLEGAVRNSELLDAAVQSTNTPAEKQSSSI